MEYKLITLFFNFFTPPGGGIHRGKGKITMIYELRLKRKYGAPKTLKLIFTDHTCKGRPIAYADRKSCNYDSMELLQRHFSGYEKNRDYGYGRGYEPIIVGAA